MYAPGAAAPDLAADAYIRGGSKHPRCLDLEEYRGTWAVVAYGVRGRDLAELAALEDAFEGGGGIVVATTPSDHHDVKARCETDPSLARVRFPVLTSYGRRGGSSSSSTPAGSCAGLGSTARHARRSRRSKPRALRVAA